MAPNYEKIVNSELTRFWGLSYQDFIDNFIKLTPIRHGANILDIATGTGVIPIYLRNKLGNGNHIHGLDITHSMLIHANRNIGKINQSEFIYLTCASAMDMPYPQESFDLIFCGLATHHMNVDFLLKESYRILQLGGQLSFADVGSTKLWQIPGVKWIIRFLAFCYYAVKEGTTRAWAEASAVSNVRTAEGWQSLLENNNFKNISIRELKSRFFWIPSPLVILAEKLEEEFYD